MNAERSTTAPEQWGPVLDEMLRQVGWTLRQTGFTAEDVAAAALVPAEDEPTPGRLLREQYVALTLQSGVEVQAVRGGLVIPPTRSAQP